MALFDEWATMVVEIVQAFGQDTFWKEYGEVEKKIYSKILANKEEVIKGKVKDLAEKYQVSSTYFMGFLDGINTSLKNPLKLEEIEEDSEIEINIDFEKLYLNMISSEAFELCQMPEWNLIFDKDKFNEINLKKGKNVIAPIKVGRNDACPCGSGKKYKNCCGKN
ncbi:hypothetical protein CLOACE_15130 [Clostridium acetireducens DSM 10703]|uniref:Preprotein translocase subunit SecA n=1 Tax=Clostridium acetireducens DSM 10703 TaxID=1121290 RepID=A0A1E8EXZ5_9CLOT|nr:SEC-C metal-binding domain-containing protein [Clostridium acetireducens]OFI05818.1 hypothetical protein CLOACE_15130 [Clostridium acetireducens DSM 10703]